MRFRPQLLFPIAALAVGAFGLPALGPAAVTALVMLVLMGGAVFESVHYADAISHRIDEPFGTIVLTLAVTLIEVSIITTMMLAPGSNSGLARDTVFAVIMIVCNGLIGACVLFGGVRHREQGFQISGASAYLVVLSAIAVLAFILPNYTLSEPGPFFSTGQLLFISVVTVALYAVFLFVQTVRHVEYFRSEGEDGGGAHAAPEDRLSVSLLSLLLSLGGVILIAKKFSLLIDASLSAAGAPPALSGIIVALIVLAPESIAALQAAKRNLLQKSVNLALGSALATIGLTIPAVAVTSLLLGKPLQMGLNQRDIVLLVLTLFVSVLTFGTGRTNVLSGLGHLVIFATFLGLVFLP